MLDSYERTNERIEIFACVFPFMGGNSRWGKDMNSFVRWMVCRLAFTAAVISHCFYIKYGWRMLNFFSPTLIQRASSPIPPFSDFMFPQSEIVSGHINLYCHQMSNNKTPFRRTVKRPISVSLESIFRIIGVIYKVKIPYTEFEKCKSGFWRKYLWYILKNNWPFFNRKTFSGICVEDGEYKWMEERV